MTNEQKALLTLLSNSLFNADLQLETRDINWKEVFEESKINAVPCIAYYGIKSTDIIPKSLKADWQIMADVIVKDNLRIDNEHLLVHQLLSENNIKYCILKGSASAYYYNNPYYRVMGDVDFYINSSDLNKAINIFVNNGFIKSSKKHSFHIILTKQPTRAEIHFDFPGIPKNKYQDVIHQYLNNCLNDAQLKTVINDEMYLPSDFCHGLILLLHTSYHTLANGVGLRHLCDWAVFANHFSSKEFESMFKERLINCGLWKFACILTKTSSLYLGLPQKSFSVNIDDGLCLNVIDDVFSSGNFGIKNTNSNYEEYFISSNGNVSNKKSLNQFFSSLNNVIMNDVPAVKKHRILLPLYQIKFFIVKSFQIVFRKRKALNIFKVVKNSKARKKLYYQFELYKN